MGLVGCPWAICDEPGAWETNGGQLLNDAIETAKGKPGSPLRAVYIGTLAPATDGWWHDLIKDGSRGSVYVQALRGDPEKWDTSREIRRCNPLTAIFRYFPAQATRRAGRGAGGYSAQSALPKLPLEHTERR